MKCSKRGSLRKKPHCTFGKLEAERRNEMFFRGVYLQATAFHLSNNSFSICQFCDNNKINRDFVIIGIKKKKAISIFLKFDDVYSFF